MILIVRLINIMIMRIITIMKTWMSRMTKTWMRRMTKTFSRAMSNRANHIMKRKVSLISKIRLKRMYLKTCPILLTRASQRTDLFYVTNTLTLLFTNRPKLVLSIKHKLAQANL